MIIDQRRRDLGGGFEVGRVLPFAKRRMVGPFIFFDHMGPVDLAPGLDRKFDVRAHPHVGLSTVSYLFSGEIMHRDSLGYEQPIRPQEVNWMTAGSGITHSERFEHARAVGDRLHGIQAWVALPEEFEEIAPSFTHYAGTNLPNWKDGGVVGHLIAGSAYGLTAGAKTHSPLFYAHLEMEPGAVAEVPDKYEERALYIAAGAVEMQPQFFHLLKTLRKIVHGAVLWHILGRSIWRKGCALRMHAKRYPPLAFRYGLPPYCLALPGVQMIPALRP